MFRYLGRYAMLRSVILYYAIMRQLAAASVLQIMYTLYTFMFEFDHSVLVMHGIFHCEVLVRVQLPIKSLFLFQKNLEILI